MNPITAITAGGTKRSAPMAFLLFEAFSLGKTTASLRRKAQENCAKHQRMILTVGGSVNVAYPSAMEPQATASDAVIARLNITSDRTVDDGFRLRSPL